MNDSGGSPRINASPNNSKEVGAKQSALIRRDAESLGALPDTSVEKLKQCIEEIYAKRLY